MTTPGDDPMALIVELIQAGLELRAAGGAVMFRPRSRMTPDLRERLAACKAEVAAILPGVTVTYGGDRIETPPRAAECPALPAWPPPRLPRRRVNRKARPKGCTRPRRKADSAPLRYDMERGWIRNDTNGPGP